MTKEAWPRCIIDARFVRVIVSLVFGYGLMLPWGASAQSPSDTTAFAPYAGALHARPMVEGLGFEGALTVFDEVRRMHRKLGKPSKRSDLYYRYEGGGFILEVFGRYEAGRFEIARIRYSGDERRRIRTDTGFRLGDPISQVLDSHGPPDSSAGGTYVWTARGVTYEVGTTATISAITVYRPIAVSPSDKRTQLVALETAPSVSPSAPSNNSEGAAAPLVLDTAPTLTLADIGISIPLSTWTTTTPLTHTGAAFSTPEGIAVLDISTCTSCDQVIIDAASDREKRLGNNVLLPSDRQPDRASLARLGADRAYVGVYHSLSKDETTWMWALRAGQRSWLITMTVRTDIAHHPEVAFALQVIRGLRVMSGDAK